MMMLMEVGPMGLAVVIVLFLVHCRLFREWSSWVSLADFGRRGVEFPVIDARRDFAGGCGRWHLVIVELHRFLSPSPELWLIMMMVMVLHLIR